MPVSSSTLLPPPTPINPKEELHEKSWMAMNCFLQPGQPWPACGPASCPPPWQGDWWGAGWGCRPQVCSLSPESLPSLCTLLWPAPRCQWEAMAMCHPQLCFGIVSKSAIHLLQAGLNMGRMVQKQNAHSVNGYLCIYCMRQKKIK